MGSKVDVRPSESGLDRDGQIGPVGNDPNEGSTDPMVPEYWNLGEELQDRIRSAGYDAETVDGIAVDVHDLLQTCDKIRGEVIPTAVNSADIVVHLEQLRSDLAHIRWHTLSAEAYLAHALTELESSRKSST